MPNPLHLSKRERQIMDVIYARGQASATDVFEAMVDRPSRESVRTLVRILEQKGHITHGRRKEGREFLYRPTQPRGRAGRSAFGRVLDVFFGGSLEQAVAAHLSAPGRKGRPDDDELRRLSRLIQEARRKGA